MDSEWQVIDDNSNVSLDEKFLQWRTQKSGVTCPQNHLHIDQCTDVLQQDWK
jgi:hypothetical protein